MTKIVLTWSHDSYLAQLGVIPKLTYIYIYMDLMYIKLTIVNNTA